MLGPASTNLFDDDFAGANLAAWATTSTNIKAVTATTIIPLSIDQLICDLKQLKRNPDERKRQSFVSKFNYDFRSGTSVSAPSRRGLGIGNNLCGKPIRGRPQSLHGSTVK